MATLGLPKNIEALANEGSVKLFGKWETADVDVGYLISDTTVLRIQSSSCSANVDFICLFDLYRSRTSP